MSFLSNKYRYDGSRSLAVQLSRSAVSSKTSRAFTDFRLVVSGGKANAKKVDSYLQDLARTAGDDVLPDYLAPLFTYTRDGESQKVELNGREYVEYAGQRTETAYDLLELFLPDAKSLPTDTQADVVRSVESYATQTAKAEVSDFEPDSWVRKVQAQAGHDPDQVSALPLP